MKIIMLSDFHISDTFNLDHGLRMISRIIDALSPYLCSDEEIMILSCGDIIHYGNPFLFSQAKYVFDFLQNRLSELNPKFRFVPGNHDLCNGNFDDFDAFVNGYSDYHYSYSQHNAYCELIEDINFIYANSTLNANYSFGQLDYQAIANCIDDSHCNILVCHHSPYSEDNQGLQDAVIRESFRLFDPSFFPSPYYIFHGHYHGDQVTPIANDGLIIEAGSLFYLRENVNNQFCFIEIDDGRISKVSRFTYEDNYEEYRQTVLYPFLEPKKVIKKNVDKINYSDADHYISRMVAPFSLIQEGGLALYWDHDSKTNLYELLQQEKHIVLLGEAGCGKSMELQHLASQLSDSSCPYYPILISLNTYTDEAIDQLIPGNYRKLNTDELFLIFDGYDEIEPKNLNHFARKLNLFVSNSPNTPVLISSRNNFYRLEQENKKGTFAGFKEYSICPLLTSDIQKYIEGQSINFRLFWRKIVDNKLNEIMCNPFYLVQIANLYKTNPELSLKTNLMNQLIRNKFSWDQSKYINTKDIEDAEQDLLLLLEKVSFSLQVMQKINLSNEEYQRICSSEERELLKYSGIWNNKMGQWVFEHNNFKEYLTAQYLSDKPISVIQDLITYPYDRNQIRITWHNVLSFLVLIYEDSALLNWLKSVVPSLVVKFESTRVDLVTRKQIFIDIFNDYKQKNIWISRSENNECELACFGQQPDTLVFLLHEIESPVHFRAQSNALHLIQNFTNLYGQEEKVKEVLLLCCKNENTRVSFKNRALGFMLQKRYPQNYGNSRSRTNALFFNLYFLISHFFKKIRLSKSINKGNNWGCLLSYF